MPGPLLPLFPLQLVLFPRTVLPLHIFEERYKEMFAEIIRDHSEFGVVQAGEKGIVNAGCTATVERIVRKYDDGRLDLLSLGRRRFEILSLNDELAYLRGEVEFFDDEFEEDAPRELRTKAIAEFGVLKAATETDVAGEPEVDDPFLSFQVAQIVPDLDFRQLLLSTRSESERLRRFNEFVPGFLIRHRHAAHIKSVAPRNGHAKVKIA